MKKFDLFLTVGPNDFSVIKHTLKVNMKNIKGYGNIYLFNENKTFNIKNTTNISPSFFPFTFEYVQNKVANKSRSGWIFQQLIKLYFPLLQSESENVLVVDSDVFFLREVNFFDGNKEIFTVSDEFHPPYFEHMLRVHPEFKRERNKSGISHHMLFNKKKLTSMFETVEKLHNKPFYEVYLESINSEEQSPCSEYEMYLHYVLREFQNEIKIRELKWSNENCINKDILENYDFFSLPYYSNTRPNHFWKNIFKGNFERAYISFINLYYLFFSKKI